MQEPIETPLVENRFHLVADLCHRYQASEISIYRWEKAGLIPEGFYIGARRAWPPDMVREADANLIGKRRRPHSHRDYLGRDQ